MDATTAAPMMQLCEVAAAARDFAGKAVTLDAVLENRWPHGVLLRDAVQSDNPRCVLPLLGGDEPLGDAKIYFGQMGGANWHKRVRVRMTGTVTPINEVNFDIPSVHYYFRATSYATLGD